MSLCNNCVLKSFFALEISQYLYKKKNHIAVSEIFQYCATLVWTATVFFNKVNSYSRGKKQQASNVMSTMKHPQLPRSNNKTLVELIWSASPQRVVTFLGKRTSVCTVLTAHSLSKYKSALSVDWLGPWQIALMRTFCVVVDALQVGCS